MSKKSRKIQTGTVPGRVGSRTEKALKRLKQLTATLESEGLSPSEAKARAMEIMRDNARGDWRAG